MRNIIIDCDPGHDDILAILVALANKDKLNIKGITTVAGNQTLEKVTRNTLNFLSYINEDVPVARGCDCPIIKPLDIGDGKEIHGESGLAGFEFPKPTFKLHSSNAVNFMYNIIMDSDEKITLVPTGPLTNIGLLLKCYPEVKDKIELISLMGGSIYSGNVTPSAEFNLYADPDAAKIVFNSDIPIVMSGLEVTHKAYVTFDEVEDILKKNKKVSKMIGGLLHFYGHYFKTMEINTMPLHDVCAILYLTHPSLFKGEYYHVDVEANDGVTRGKTVADLRDGISRENANTYVLLDIDRDKFYDIIISTIDYFDSLDN